MKKIIKSCLLLGIFCGTFTSVQAFTFKFDLSDPTSNYSKVVSLAPKVGYAVLKKAEYNSILGVLQDILNVVRVFTYDETAGKLFLKNPNGGDINVEIDGNLAAKKNVEINGNLVAKKMATGDLLVTNKLDLNGKKITSMATGTANNDAVTKAQVQALISASGRYDGRATGLHCKQVVPHLGSGKHSFCYGVRFDGKLCYGRDFRGVIRDSLVALSYCIKKGGKNYWKRNRYPYYMCNCF